MGGFVQMDKDLDDDPRVLELTDRIVEYLRDLGVPEPIAEALRPLMRNASLGSLYALWRHGDTHLQRHDRLGIASHHLAEVTRIPVTVLRKFPSRWLVEHPDGGIELPNYSTKNALLNKDERREGGKRRTAKWRAKKRAARDASQGVTGDASHCHDSVTTGTGTGTHPDTSPDLKNPLPPPSGGSAVNSHGKREEGTNPRARGTNPRAQAERAAEEARWRPLLERARACGFREPWDVDTPETYETGLRLHERTRANETTPPRTEGHG